MYIEIGEISGKNFLLAQISGYPEMIVETA
jgi:hypothetical protein